MELLLRSEDAYDCGNCHKLSGLSAGSGDRGDPILEGSDPLFKNFLNTPLVHATGDVSCCDHERLWGFRYASKHSQQS